MPSPAPWALTYDDKADLPENAGNKRCPEAPKEGAKPAIVMLELAANPPGVDIVIPSLGVKQRMWPGANNPTECHASISDRGKAIRFHCSEDQSSVDGKIYFRQSDVAIGRTSNAGTTHTRFVVPCGTPVKLEPIACPSACVKGTLDQCECGRPRGDGGRDDVGSSKVTRPHP